MKHFLSIFKRHIRSLTSFTQTKEERRHALVGPADLWKMKRDFQIQFLCNMGLKPCHYLFEIGCGTLRGGIPLIQYLENAHYYGVEVREKALNEGRKELEEAGLEGKNPTLLLYPNITQLAVSQRFDYIWAFSVLIHMTDETLNNTLDFVNRHLREDGAFYANVTIGARQEGSWQGFPVVARTFDFYRQACGTNGLAVSDLGTLKDLGHIANEELQDNQRMLKISKETA